VLRQGVLRGGTRPVRPRRSASARGLTPLYHGIALERDLLLGQVGWGVLAHIAYLLALGAIGILIAGRRLERLLLS
jgi:hypothetical protein